jgi:chromate transporter
VAVAALAPTALRGPVTIAMAVGAAALTLLGADPVVVIVAGLLGGVLLGGIRTTEGDRAWLKGIVVGGLPSAIAAPVAAVSSISLAGLFTLFLKVGLFSFGSGYVLLAFLRTDLVSTGLLTNQQLLDATAVGQVTPGPVYTTATFIGYLLMGVPGAIVATLAIFLPAFVGVALVHPWIPRLRANTVASAVLDAIGAVALGLIAAVTVELARSALIDAVTITLAVVSLAVMLRRPHAAVPLLLIGGVVGYVVHAANIV